jgi:hypothetical protein
MCPSDGALSEWGRFMAARVGAQIHPQQASYAQMRDAWLRVEEMGADTLFTWGHFGTGR